jgi:hypothetical protein
MSGGNWIASSTRQLCRSKPPSSLWLLGLLALSAASAAQVPPQTGKIIVFRSGAFFGAVLGCPIRHKGQEIASLGRNDYVEWNVGAGRYILTNKHSGVEVNVAPGETRYVRCEMKTGFSKGRADLQIVDDAEFSKSADQMTQKPLTASASAK